MAGTVSGLGVLVRQWRTGRLLIDLRLLRLRLVAGCALLAEWGLLACLLLVDPRRRPGVAVACLFAAVVLCLLLLLLAWLDLRFLRIQRLRAETRLSGELARRRGVAAGALDGPAHGA
jgi:hypothetical protein